jgi:hypothetical protein
MSLSEKVVSDRPSWSWLEVEQRGIGIARPYLKSAENDNSTNLTLT